MHVCSVALAGINGTNSCALGRNRHPPPFLPFTLLSRCQDHLQRASTQLQALAASVEALPDELAAIQRQLEQQIQDGAFR